jgi:hypothetical protein
MAPKNNLSIIRKEQTKMVKSVYEKYIARKPLYEACPGVTKRQSPTMTFMSSQQVPEANYYIELGWIYDIPEPNPHVFEHVHDFDEIILHWGGAPEVPQDLGGEIEFYIGGQPVTFNTTTGIFIPKGTPHGPLMWKKFRFPHIQMALMLGTGNRAEGWGKSGIRMPKKTAPKKTAKFDFEQYVIRSPVREAGTEFLKGRQTPTMTYMSRTQINVADYYIEFGWIWDIVEPGISTMIHKKFDEIVLHIGGDPKNPEDLGADMRFGMGDDLLSFSTSSGIYIPRGLKHGPVIWDKVRKPHIEMAIMLGCGTVQEGWEDSKINP